ncbi:MAG TPA: thioesterase domain-containing protein, partial [Pyrinomonadaceae bacterium]|nr:thioesterase domain-containing protein [Pyrinomonadaceae bacterium]
VAAIRHHQPVGPYFLGGWSMGGLIAFEMARLLQQQQQQIAMLALIDAYPPDEEAREFNWAVLLSIFAFDLGLTYEKVGTPEEMAKLPQMAQLRRVWVEAKRAGVVPSDMTLIEFRKLFDTFKINVDILRRYRPGEYQGRITFFCPEDDVDQFLFRQDTQYKEWRSQNLTVDTLVKGWEGLATEGIDVHVIPGDHFSIIREPHVQVLGAQLSKCIDEAVRALGNGSH